MLHNREFHVRDIMAMAKDRVWELPDGGLWLTFDNDERVKVPTRSTIESSYYWKLALEWPGLEITKRHHLMFGDYQDGTHCDLSSKVYWDVFFGHHKEFMRGEGQETIWAMSKRIYQISNELYNDYITMLGEHCTSMDIEDIVEILDHPTVVEGKKEFEDGLVIADVSHDKVYGLMKTDDPKLQKNEIVRGCKADILNRRQITQVIGGRAFVPDINGETCKTPIYVGYADGLDSIYDRFRESRTASISLYMASGPLEQSEYNNRMCQFLCGVIAGVHYGDCGGQIVMPWLVEEGDLKALAGKYHMVDDNPVMLTGIENELVGTKINIRSITTCTHTDPTRPCSVCVGFNALTTPPGTNLGHHLSTEPLARISQTILSTKHVLASTKSVHLDINKTNAAFLRLDPEKPQNVFFNSTIAKDNYGLRIAQEDAAFINDVKSVDDISELTAARITALQNVQLVQYSRGGTIRAVHDINLSIGGKGSPLTLEFLDYMKGLEWEVVGQSIEVSLKDWDIGVPFVTTPRRGEDIMTILRTTSGFLHSPNEANMARAVDSKTPAEACRALLDVMSAKIHVNFTHVEVFVRALMAAGDESYALPRGGEPFRFIRLKEAIQKRGLGAALAFEGTSDILLTSGSYLRHKDVLPGHPLDAFVQ